MKHNQIKGTDLSVSPVCLGTWQFNDGDNSEMYSTWSAQPRETSKAILNKALELGVNFIDTAEGYRNSEKVLGSLLSGKRRDVVIASKFGYCADGPYSAADIETHLMRSLASLQTDYLDIYQVHWPNVVADAAEAVKELKRQQSLGRIRYYGVCNHGVKNMQAFANAGGKPITNQLPYNLLWRTIENEIAPACERHGMSVLAYSALQQGLLTGKFTSVSDVPEGRRRTRLFNSGSTKLARHGTDGAEKEVFQALARVREICAESGLSMEGASLSWLLGRGPVSGVIVGATTVDQVHRNCSSLHALTQEVADKLTECTEEVKAVLGSQVDMWGADAEDRAS